jgi:hypothetical protein
MFIDMISILAMNSVAVRIPISGALVGLSIGQQVNQFECHSAMNLIHAIQEQWMNYHVLPFSLKPFVRNVLENAT